MRRAPRTPFAAAVASAALLGGAEASAGTRTVGLNVHQSADVGIAVTAACKGSLVRVDFNWFAVEATPGTYDWSVLDAVVDAATAKGLNVIATLGYTPAWAATSGQDDSMNNAVPAKGTYAAFVTAAVQHDLGKVTYWELWNEPNLSQFFQGTAGDYVLDVLLPGAEAVRSACPSCKVLAPAVATVGSNYADWMKTVFTLAGPSIDIVTGHDYADFPDMGAGMTSPDFLNKLEKHRVIKVGGSVLYEDPLSIRESMVKYGVADKPFWLTETGYEAAYGDSAAEATQAHYVAEVLNAMPARPWWEATVFYDAFDVSGQPDHWGFSLADPDASVGYELKPACGVLADPPPPDAGPLAIDASAEASVRDAGRDAVLGEASAEDDSGLIGDAGLRPVAPSSACGCRVPGAAGGGEKSPLGWFASLAASLAIGIRRRRTPRRP